MKPRIWPAAVSLTLIAAILQYCIFLPRLGLFLQLDGLVVPRPLMTAIGTTLLLHIALWGIFGLALAYLTQNAWRILAHTRWHITDVFNICIGVFILLLLTCWLANAYYFPRSYYSLFITSVIPIVVVPYLYFACITLVALLALSHYTGIIMALSIAAVWFIRLPQAPLAPTQSPHVILIGIDSLRTDKLALMPKLQNFLKQSTQFTDTITPMARTFPAWVALLTGQYPFNNGARYDLAAKNSVNYPLSLAHDFKQLGYNTLYATDETRFSNIDKDYGFDALAIPKMGVGDFILGNFHDFPMTNLLLQLPIAQWLMPYQYSNRAANFSYYPVQLNQRLGSAIDQLPQRPTLLAIHYCLSHWPFVYAPTPRALKPAQGIEVIRDVYAKSLRAVDTQFDFLLKRLRERGLLQNAIVVVFSDHGESLGYPNDSLLATPTYGHGLDVLSPAQNRVLLAFRRFGPADKPQRWDFPTSLVDVKPTLLSFVGHPKASDGYDLSSYINQTPPPPPGRFIYTESGFAPDAIINKNPSKLDVLRFGLSHYYVDPVSGRVALKDKTIAMLMAQKQIAAYTPDWVMARLPKDNYVLHPRHKNAAPAPRRALKQALLDKL